MIKESTDPVELVATTISFVIPLSKALNSSNVHFLLPGESTSGCTGGSVTTPKADPGNLCVYMGTTPFGLGGGKVTLTYIGNPATGVFGASKEGALLGINGEPGLYNGTWAVTDG